MAVSFPLISVPAGGAAVFMQPLLIALEWRKLPIGARGESLVRGAVVERSFHERCIQAEFWLVTHTSAAVDHRLWVAHREEMMGSMDV